MTGSPFSNVLGTGSGASTFTDVESTQTSDTTSETAARPPDSPSEPSLGVEVAAGVTKVASEDETAGGATSGPPSDQT